ncbi:MAG: ThiF family adenylyltransferase [Phycisphaerae bacterium]|nr:ThiF family adenylyltransferase [Phycisphaerae bacterium]
MQRSHVERNHVEGVRHAPIVVSEDADRFARFALISWWDQAKLRGAKVVVVGAGAIGNELLKNLALLGVGNVVIIDLDRVEHSNLARSVLFRADDRGRPKAEVAAARVRELYPDARTRSLVADVVHGIGLGLVRWADVVIAGLDNREARVAINQMAALAGRPWIDGAIERLSGVARMFDPETGPCYECTMGEADRRALAHRRSCALLTREQLETGHVPTTPTTASVIAGIQCQELVKYLHGLETLTGRGFVFEGHSHQSYVVNYTRDPDCPSHESIGNVEPIPHGARALRARDLLEIARARLGAGAVVDFGRDLLSSLECARCATSDPTFGSLGTVRERDAHCPRCGELRAPRFFSTVRGDEPFLDRTLFELGVPLWDVPVARNGQATLGLELAHDATEVLGDAIAAPSPNQNEVSR